MIRQSGDKDKQVKLSKEKWWYAKKILTGLLKGKTKC